jgi:hypothetical protein
LYSVYLRIMRVVCLSRGYRYEIWQIDCCGIVVETLLARTGWIGSFSVLMSYEHDAATRTIGMKEKYGIIDEDMYNFGESGYLMGNI